MVNSLSPHQPSSGTMFKLTILGDGGVGKTALVIQLCLNRFVETYDPTIEDSYRKRILLDGQATTLEILDTAGQEDYAALREQWIRDGEGFLLIYSITDRSSFERTKNYYEQLIRVKEGESFGLVLVGNKCDEEDYREVGPLEGERLAQSWDVPFFETSARFDINIDHSFIQAARLTRNTHDDESPPSSRSSFDRGEQQRQGSYSSTQSDYSNTNSTVLEGYGEPSGLPSGGLLHPFSQNGKPPLLSQRSDSWASSRRSYGSYEPTQIYARPSVGKQPTAQVSAGSFADSDGGDTIVARPRTKKKKAKCAIM